MNKYFILLITSLYFLSCSSDSKIKEEAPDNMDYIYNLDFSYVELSNESYKRESLKILEKHKIRLSKVLPNLILDQVNILQDVFSETEKASVKSFDIKHTWKLIEEEKNRAANELFEKEMDINSEYFLLLYELQQLNFYFENSPLEIQPLFNYFDVGPIVLAEEVSYKIEELVKDESIRSELENSKFHKGLIVDGVFLITSVIPVLSTVGPSMQIYAGLAKNTVLKKMVATVKNFNFDSNLQSTIQNPMRLNLNQYKDVSKGLFQPLKTVYDNQKDKQSGIDNYIKEREYFKVIENKIEGRIGDFSDGILAVHLQRVRDLIKENENRIVATSIGINK